MSKQKQLKIQNKKLALLGILLLCAVILLPYISKNAKAATLNYTASVSWNDSLCSGTINGQSTIYYGVAANDNITIEVSNSSLNQHLDIHFLSSSGAQGDVSDLPPGQAEGDTYAVPKWIEFSISSNSCSGPHNNATLIVEGASGSIACNLIGNTWSITGHYTNTLSSVLLFNGTQSIASFGSGFTNNTASSTDINLSRAATTSATTFSLYNGYDTSARQIGQATCPAGPPPSATPQSKQPNPTPTPPTLSPTASTPSPSTPNSTQTLTPTSNNQTPITITTAKASWYHTFSKWLELLAGIIVLAAVILGLSLHKKKKFF